MESHYSFATIGVVHSCFKEKFGVPRQPGLVPESRAQLELLPPYNRAEAVSGLAFVSHIWLQFIFHEVADKAWSPTVRPPRLGGNKRMGVFATRSPVRPNPLGLSVVKLEDIEIEGGKVTLHLSGIDLVDGTPIVDIKPYVPYVDLIPEASNEFASDVPVNLSVNLSLQAEADCEKFSQEHPLNIRTLVTQVLQQDPKPSYHAVDSTRVYGMKLLNFDLQWRYIVSELADGESAVSIEVIALQGEA